MNSEMMSGGEHKENKPMSTNNIQGWSERFRNLFSGESALSQAILGALEYRGFYDSGKYLDDTIAERIIPVLEPFIASEIQKAEVRVLDEVLDADMQTWGRFDFVQRIKEIKDRITNQSGE